MEKLVALWEVKCPDLASTEIGDTTVKKLVREGVPPPFRRKVWLHVTGADKALERSPDMYKRALESTFQGSSPDDVDGRVPLFGGSLSPEQHHLSPAAAKQYLDESESFAIVRQLFALQTRIRRHLNPNKTKAAVFADAFNDILQRRASKVQKHLTETANVSVTLVARDWFDNFFLSVLPYEVCVHIIDCFLSEGSKVLYRFALALFFNAKKKILSCKSETEAMNVIIAAGREAESHEGISKDAFGIRNLSKAGVAELEAKNAAVDSAAKSFYEPSIGNAGYYRPKVLGESRLLNSAAIEHIWTWLPPKHQYDDASLVFSTEQHGLSMRTFFERTELSGPSLLMIRDTKGNVFGAYCPVSWKPSGRDAFGNGESFVFTLTPDVQVFKWPGSTQANSQFFVADTVSGICVGGGSTGSAISVDAELSEGSTAPCETFASPALVPESSSSDGDFVAAVIEVICIG